MRTTLKFVSVGCSLAFATVGVGLAAHALGDLGDVTARPLAAVGAGTPVPEEYSTVVTTRDWNEVISSRSDIGPRGSSDPGFAFSPPAPTAPVLAETSVAGAPAALVADASGSTADRTATIAGAAAPGTTPPPQLAAAIPTPQEAAFLAALRDAAQQPVQPKEKPGTKSSKKAPRR